MSTPNTPDRGAAPPAPPPGPAPRQPTPPRHPGSAGPHQPPRYPAAARPPQPATQRPSPDRVELVGRVAPGDSALRKMWRTMSRTMSGNAAARELAELTAAAQVPVTTGRRIAVTSVRGGSGKSAISALLSSLLAARRAEPVLAADADPAAGSLPWRLGLVRYPALTQLAPRLLAARGGDLRGLDQLLPRTGTGLWVLPGGAAGRTGLVRDVTRALSRLFALCVTDCGALELSETTEVLGEAHAVVLVCPATADGVRSTYGALARMATGETATLSRVVVVLNTTSVDGRAALRERAAMAAFGRFDVPMVTMPYDRHVAGGALIQPSQIGEATLVEITRLAAHVLARARQF